MKSPVEKLFDELWNTPKDKFVWNAILERIKKEEETSLDFYTADERVLVREGNYNTTFGPFTYKIHFTKFHSHKTNIPTEYYDISFYKKTKRIGFEGYPLNSCSIQQAFHQALSDHTDLQEHERRVQE